MEFFSSLSEHACYFILFIFCQKGVSLHELVMLLKSAYLLILQFGEQTYLGYFIFETFYLRR